MLRMNDNRRELIKGEFAKEIRRQAALACKTSKAIRSEKPARAKKSIEIVWK